jgi:predicted ArsR family transcriptional regulator
VTDPAWALAAAVRLVAGTRAETTGTLPELIDELLPAQPGRSRRQIAERLAITPHTVKFHVANILRKLDVASRGEAAALAREHGMSAPDRAA